jgi:hypothetical protein
VRGSWEPNSRRCGLLAIKIGVQPLWLKSGKMLVTTMLQIQAGAAAGHLKGDCSSVRVVSAVILVFNWDQIRILSVHFCGHWKEYVAN